MILVRILLWLMFRRNVREVLVEPPFHDFDVQVNGLDLLDAQCPICDRPAAASAVICVFCGEVVKPMAVVR